MDRAQLPAQLADADADAGTMPSGQPYPPGC
jgi:hypothetical protein